MDAARLTPFPPAEIERRAPLWAALSALFLDSPFTEADAAAVAGAVRASGLPAAAAERILRNEVAPVFVANLLSPAGAWAPWSEDFVRERIVAHLLSPMRPAAGAAGALAWSIIAADWEKVLNVLRNEGG